MALVGGCAIAAVTATGALVGALTQGMDGLKVVRIGAVALVAGAALMTASVSAESLWLLFTASVVVGIDFGGAFQGGLRPILAETPTARRAGALSTVYIVSYFALGRPAVIACILTPTLGLHTVVGERRG
ncbi:hypothetical protein OG568_50480 (plasmid) [Streptomyces sp. NBC_01450]|uniref:hypothetical protein n=1 Tax=Streptomyces sp. NBC_01450 TaxID=2903871 RepID=UPI002E348864|nr:hypothetical protein [Streptomyces sp. NBC_01450]